MERDVIEGAILVGKVDRMTDEPLVDVVAEFVRQAYLEGYEDGYCDGFGEHEMEPQENYDNSEIKEKLWGEG